MEAFLRKSCSLADTGGDYRIGSQSIIAPNVSARAKFLALSKAVGASELITQLVKSFTEERCKLALVFDTGNDFKWGNEPVVDDLFGWVTWLCGMVFTEREDVGTSVAFIADSERTTLFVVLQEVYAENYAVWNTFQRLAQQHFESFAQDHVEGVRIRDAAGLSSVPLPTADWVVLGGDKYSHGSPVDLGSVAHLGSGTGDGAPVVVLGAGDLQGAEAMREAEESSDVQRQFTRQPLGHGDERWAVIATELETIGRTTAQVEVCTMRNLGNVLQQWSPTFFARDEVYGYACTDSEVMFHRNYIRVVGSDAVAYKDHRRVLDVLFPAEKNLHARERPPVRVLANYTPAEIGMPPPEDCFLYDPEALTMCLQMTSSQVNKLPGVLSRGTKGGVVCHTTYVDERRAYIRLHTNQDAVSAFVSIDLSTGTAVLRVYDSAMHCTVERKLPLVVPILLQLQCALWLSTRILPPLADLCRTREYVSRVTGREATVVFPDRFDAEQIVAKVKDAKEQLDNGALDVYLWGGTGSGKSYTGNHVAHALFPDRCDKLVPFTRNTTGIHLSQQTGATMHSDVKRRDVTLPASLAVTFESMLSFSQRQRPYDVVFNDEIESYTSTWLSRTVHERHLESTLQYYFRQRRSAKLNLNLDAHLSQYTIDYSREMLGIGTKQQLLFVSLRAPPDHFEPPVLFADPEMHMEAIKREAAELKARRDTGWDEQGIHTNRLYAFSWKSTVHEVAQAEYYFRKYEIFSKPTLL